MMISVPTAYLHLGIEKTGTTTIQNFLASNRDALLRKGVGFPRTPGNINHFKLNAYALADDKFDDTRERFGLRSPDQVHTFRDEFRQELYDEVQRKLSGCRKIVFSNEHCSARLTTAEEAQRLLDLLDPLAADIVVVVYLREQAANMVSSYSTNMRTGKTRLPDFDAINWDKYDYFRRISRWADLVGRDNVRLRIFDRSELVDNDLIRDFMATIDESWDDDLRVPVPRNVSLDARSLRFLRLLNEATNDLSAPENAQEVRTWAINGLEQLPVGRRLAFPPDKIRWLRDSCAESNQRLAREFLGRDELFTINDDTSDEGVLYSDPSAREVMDTFLAIAAKQLAD